MGVQHDELFDALIIHLFGNAEPAVDGFVEGEGPGAGDMHMFDRIANGFSREKCDGERRRKRRDESLHETLRNQRIGVERQVRTMLFVGAQGQYRDPVASFCGLKCLIIVTKARFGMRHLAVVSRFRYG
ncbi:hypothetical protein D3C87_1491920 [compost metagenome]